MEFIPFVVPPKGCKIYGPPISVGHPHDERPDDNFMQRPIPRIFISIALVASVGLHLIVLLSLVPFLIEPKVELRDDGLSSAWQESESVEFETIELTTVGELEPEIAEAESENELEPELPGLAEDIELAAGLPNMTLVSLPAVFDPNANAGSSGRRSAGSQGRTATVHRVASRAGGSPSQEKQSGGSFFGVRGEGNRFVYVVDCSGSMNERNFGANITRFGRLKNELTASIQGLNSHQSFFVIFFNHQAHPMPAKNLLPSIPRHQNQFVGWMRRIPAMGDTDPRMAMMTAMRLRPDVIYFLTDGEFPVFVSNDLLQMRSSNVTVHTLAFGEKGSEPILKQIAENNNGQYHFVP